MRAIETKPIGDANFYKFSIDFVGDEFIIGGKTLPLLAGLGGDFA